MQRFCSGSCAGITGDYPNESTHGNGFVPKLKHLGFFHRDESNRAALRIKKLHFKGVR